VPRCGSPGDVFENCVPANIFNGFANITGDQIPNSENGGLSQVFPTNQIDNDLHLVDINFSGSLFRLPAGKVITALGYVYRREQYGLERNLMCNGCSTLDFFQRFFDDDSDIHSGYAEINVPLLKDATAAKALTFRAAIRHDEYSNTNANTTFKSNLHWRITPDFALHGNYADIFREPQGLELLLPRQDAFPSFLDVCRSSALLLGSTFNNFTTLTAAEQQRCLESGVEITGMDAQGNPLTFDQTNSQPRASIGGNQELGLETGSSFGFGTVFTPDSLNGLSLTLDYWNIQLNNTIVFPDPEVIVNNCIFGGDAIVCGLIDRQSIGNVGEVSTVNATLGNFGSESAAGVDLGIRYSHESRWGSFDGRFLLTWLNDRTSESFGSIDIQGDNLSDRIDVSGAFTRRDNLGSSVFPEWKGLFTIDWHLANFGAAINLEYLSGVDEVLDSINDLTNHIDSEVYVDISLNYTLLFGAEINAGITNIFDNDPPFIVGGLNARTDTNTYRILGRSWFVRLTQRF